MCKICFFMHSNFPYHFKRCFINTESNRYGLFKFYLIKSKSYGFSSGFCGIFSLPSGSFKPPTYIRSWSKIKIKIYILKSYKTYELFRAFYLGCKVAVSLFLIQHFIILKMKLCVSFKEGRQGKNRITPAS